MLTLRRISSAGLVVLLVATAVNAEVIDRILAVVEGQLITLSDVRGVVRLGLESAPAADDPVAVILDKLIDRQLMLVEVERYAPPEPLPASLESQLQALRARFPDALAFETTLHQIGWAADDVRRYVRDVLRIESYLQQRFTASIQPSDDELAAYYRLKPASFARGGTLPPFADVRNEVRAKLIEERRSTLVREWLLGLRRRANIQMLYLGPPTPR